MWKDFVADVEAAEVVEAVEAVEVVVPWDAVDADSAAVEVHADIYMDSAEVIVALTGVAGPISGLPRGTLLGYTPLNAVKDVDT